VDLTRVNMEHFEPAMRGQAWIRVRRRGDLRGTRRRPTTATSADPLPPPAFQLRHRT